MTAAGPLASLAWRFSLLGYPVGLARPEALLLTVAAAAVGGLALWMALGRHKRAAQLLTERGAERYAAGLSTRRPAAQAVLYGTALALFAVALAQPQCGASSEISKRRGLDVVVALDASRSMLARDVVPSRLERAKLELSTLLDELKGDRVGIVVFGGDAFIQCPLTSDYAAAKMFLRAVDTEQMQEGGTNIGAALQLSKQVLMDADRGARDRVVVLLSDGEDLSGEIGDASEGLKQEGIKVFTVGIGSETGEPIPVLNRRGEISDYVKDEEGKTVLSRLDRAALATLAEQTGGELFYTPRAVAVPQVVKRLEGMHRSEFEGRVTVKYSERFQMFLGPGLLLLALAMFLPSSKDPSSARLR